MSTRTVIAADGTVTSRALSVEEIAALAAFAPPPAQIRSMSFIQMLYGLVTEGWITQAEAEAWRDSATLPAPIVALINTLPVEQRFLATSRAKVPSVVELSNPVLQFIAAGQGKTAQLPAFFNTYGVI